MEYKTPKQLKAEQEAKRPADFKSWTLKEQLAWNNQANNEVQKILKAQQEHRRQSALSGAKPSKSKKSGKKSPTIILIIAIIAIIGFKMTSKSDVSEQIEVVEEPAVVEEVVVEEVVAEEVVSDEEKDAYNDLVEAVDVSALAYFQEIYGADITAVIEDVYVSGRYVNDSVEVMVVIHKEHNLLQGEVQNLRNTAVDLLQDNGVINPDAENREIKVVFLWKDNATYSYTFEYGAGWNE